METIDKQEIIDACTEMVQRYTRDKKLWPETLAVLEKAPFEGAELLRKTFNVGEYRHNRARCGVCEEVITSETVHHYNTCKCGGLSVDGGSYYLKRGMKADLAWEDHSELSERWPWLS